MTITPKHLIRSTLGAGALAALCAVALIPSAGAGAGGKTETLRLYVETASVTVTRPDGTVIARPPYPEARPGDVLDVTDRVFRGNHRHHGARRIGTDHLRCAFPAAGPPDCVSHVALGGSMLVFEGDPGTVVLGTGRYAGARGRVLVSREVAGGSDVVDRVVRR